MLDYICLKIRWYWTVFVLFEDFMQICAPFLSDKCMHLMIIIFQCFSRICMCTLSPCHAFIECMCLRIIRYCTHCVISKIIMIICSHYSSRKCHPVFQRECHQVFSFENECMLQLLCKPHLTAAQVLFKLQFPLFVLPGMTNHKWAFYSDAYDSLVAILLRSINVEDFHNFNLLIITGFWHYISHFLVSLLLHSLSLFNLSPVTIVFTLFHRWYIRIIFSFHFQYSFEQRLRDPWLWWHSVCSSVPFRKSEQ